MTIPESLSKRKSALCDFRLVDADGNDVADGEPGEAAVRGPTVFSGYWNAEATNARDFADGWFRMGDLFRRNPDGSYDFVDRAKYMIKSGGENIYPAEIERVLLSDPRVSDAVVVRKRDAKWGEVPVAFVARRDERLSECRRRSRLPQVACRLQAAEGGAFHALRGFSAQHHRQDPPPRNGEEAGLIRWIGCNHGCRNGGSQARVQDKALKTKQQTGDGIPWRRPDRFAG